MFPVGHLETAMRVALFILNFYAITLLKNGNAQPFSQ